MVLRVPPQCRSQILTFTKMVFARNPLSLIFAGAILALVFPGCGKRKANPPGRLPRSILPQSDH